MVAAKFSPRNKAALPFDEEFDLIAEVFDSLYEIFPITRELLLNLPPHEMGEREGIADLLMRVQNDGLRPHLTRWQADFRHWWEEAIEDPANAGLRPQEIQSRFPRYRELVADILQMNVELSRYADDLLTIATTSRPSVLGGLFGAIGELFRMGWRPKSESP